MPYETSDSWPADASRFPPTHWSVVLTAGCPDDTRSREALAKLCATYWYPLYAFVRRLGYRPEDAQDLTQAFFEHLLAHHALVTVDRAKGKFRSFLLASLRHFLADERDRAQAQKRGGGCACVPLDAAAAESRYRLEPADRDSPDKLFERTWALALMEQVLERLRAEQIVADKRAQFDLLRDGLMGDPDAPRYAELAVQLGVSEDAVKMAVSRLRRRYRELLRQEIAPTVGTPAEIEEEIRHLFVALGA
ncbi:MAG: sigma-70 family RNA polymerase sigma factor [Verrucomicrobiota bacterium]